MPSIKITALTTLTTPSANAENTVFVVVDKSSGTPTTKQISLQNLDLFVDNVGSVAFAQANGAFAQANSANVLAQNAYNSANSANTFDYTTVHFICNTWEETTIFAGVKHKNMHKIYNCFNYLYCFFVYFVIVFLFIY